MELGLKTPTDPRWLEGALEQFDAVLVDHAHCEKKAAANALSLLQAYPEVPGLALAMARLAREESGHLALVVSALERKGLQLGRDRGDPYARALQEAMRGASHERRLDRLLVAAIIEARSSERLALLAGALTDPPLRRLYGRLAQSERGHWTLFHRLALRAGDEQAVSARLEALLKVEARIVGSLGIRPAIH